jgi:hypothetical protein
MANMAFELALATPLALITVPLLGFVGATFYLNRSNLWDPIKRAWIPCILQFVLLLTAIGVASHGRVDWTHQPFPGPNESGLRMENYCIAVALILAALAVILTKGSRWFVTSLMLLQLWLLACAKEVAGMALTGRWL